MITLIETFEEDIMFGNEWSGLRGPMKTKVINFSCIKDLNNHIEAQNKKYIVYQYTTVGGHDENVKKSAS